jgi:post-segregation antitoxin (ccd killing protein)
MVNKRTNSIVRLNIYVHDPLIRRRIKTAAAQKDISVSEYCLQAIADQLAREAEMGLKKNDISLETALEKAKRFQAKTFGGRSFRVSSGDLIREARKERNAGGK